MESNNYSQEELKMALTAAIKKSIDKLEIIVNEEGLSENEDIFMGEISINSQKFDIKVTIIPKIKLH